MKNNKLFLIKLIIGALSIGVISQTHAALLTFEDIDQTVFRTAGHAYEAEYGVTFTGGGLVSDGAEGRSLKEPSFIGPSDDVYIRQNVKTVGLEVTDSYYDIWVSFSSDVTDVSGDYIGNTIYSASIFAYDQFGSELDMIFLSASTGDSLRIFNFGNLSGIRRLHLISSSPMVASGLDDLSFTAVPVPAAVWLFSSGLIGLVGLARRKNNA